MNKIKALAVAGAGVCIFALPAVSQAGGYGFSFGVSSAPAYYPAPYYVAPPPPPPPPPPVYYRPVYSYPTYYRPANSFSFSYYGR